MLMDGHSLAYRAFFALPAENFTTATGQPTNAIYGFASMLANTLRDEAPTHFAVAFDVSRKTWRSEEFPEYKANRSKTPDEFKGQVELIGELLDAMNVPRFAVEGFEADDVIATLATQAEAEGFEVLIVTGDRDSFQLVTDARHGAVPDEGRLGADPLHPGEGPGEVRPDARAVPGLRGAARRPVRQPAGHPRRRREDRREVDQPVRFVRRAGRAGRRGQGQGRAEPPRPPGVRQAQPPAHRAGARRRAGRRPRRPGARRLRPRGRSTVCWTPWSSGNPNFRERLFAVDPGARGGRGRPGVAEGVEVDGTVLGARRAGRLARGARRAAPLGVATVDTWALGTGSVTRDRAGRRRRTGRLVRPGAAGRGRRAGVRRLARGRRTAPRCVHNAKGVMRVFAEHGWSVDGVTMDTALAAYLVKPGRRSFALDALSVEYLGRELAPGGRRRRAARLRRGRTGRGARR